MNPKPCAECGTPFTPSSESPKFCSETCRETFRKRRVNEAARRRRQERNPLTERSCAVCSKPFMPKPGPAQHRQKYCSDECAEQGHKLVRIAAKSDTPVQQNRCAWCDEPFEGKGKYCSEDCHQRAIAPPTGIGGDSEYGGADTHLSEDVAVIGGIKDSGLRPSAHVARLLALSAERETRAIVYRHVYAGEPLPKVAFDFDLSEARARELLISIRRREQQAIDRCWIIGGRKGRRPGARA